MRRAFGLVAVLAASAVALGAGQASDASGPRTAWSAPQLSAPDDEGAVAVELPPCVVAPAAAGPGVRLTGAQAKAVTSIGAAATRRRLPLAHVAHAVDRVLVDGLAPGAALAAPARGAATALGLAVAQVVSGQRPGSLTCAWERRLVAEEPMGPSGLTARAAALRGAVDRAFGRQVMGGFAPGGVRGGHVEDSAHYDGRALDVFYRPLSARSSARGWALAHWLVAHADVYDVLSVIYQDRIWTVWASASGWRPYVPPSGSRTDPVLRHLDHVHTAVVRGPPRQP